MPTYLVTLATGQQGRLTAKHLLAAGATVHAVVRDPTSRPARALANAGVKLFKGTLDDTAVFREAAAGCTGVFLNLVPASSAPPSSSEPANAYAATENNVSSEQQRATSILAACREAGVKHVVASTAIYTGDSHLWDTPETKAIGLGMYQYMRSKAGMEEAVRNAGLSGGWAILRPAWLMSNYLKPYATVIYPELGEEGVLKHSYEDGVGFEHADEEDLGRYAAAALLVPEKFAEREVTIASGWLSIEDVAEVMSRVSGRGGKGGVKVSKRTAEEEKEAEKKEIPAYPFEVWANVVGDKVHEAGGQGKGGRLVVEEFGIPLTGFEAYLEEKKETLLQSLPAE